MNPSGNAADEINIAGAILAGGESRRMGRDKAHVDYRGQPMIASVAAAVTNSGVGPIVAIGGDARRAHDIGLSTIPDGWPGQGPLGGLLTAFAWSPCDLIVVVSCDLPQLTSQTIALLVDGIVDHDVAVAMTDRPEPLCAVWRISRCEPTLLAAFTARERAIHRAWVTLDRMEVAVDPVALRNVNAPHDLI